MKKILLTAMIAAFSAAAVNAQEIKDRKQDKPQLQEKQKGHSKSDWAGLNLSEEQKEKKKALKEAHQQEMEELKKQNVSEEKIKALRKEQHDQLLSILTDEQKAELEKIKAERQETKEEEKMELAEQKKAGMGKGKEEMSITELKKAKLANSNAETAAKIKAIQQDETLTAEQKKIKTNELMKKEGTKKEPVQEEPKQLKEKKGTN